MSQLIQNNNNKKSSLLYSSTRITSTNEAASCLAPTGVTLLQKHSTIKATPKSTTIPTSASLSPSNVDIVSSSSSSEISLFSMMEQQQPVSLAQLTSASFGSGRKVFRSTPTFKIMSYQNIMALLTVLVCGLVTVNGLKCYMCGQYNEGVGSITPCLNYSEQYAHLYLKECSKKSEKYCVKYVSELSIVRDCATECAEKEIWETQTYCCTEDGCNGSRGIEASATVIMLPLIIYAVKEIMNIIKQQRR